MRKYLKAIKLSSQITFVYNVNYLVASFIQLLSLLITIFMWQAVFHMNGSIDQYSFTSMIMYIFIVNTVFDLIGTNNISDKVSNDIRSGQLSIYLMRPFPHVLALFADLCGNKLTKIPMLLVLNGLVGTIIIYYSSSNNGDLNVNVTLQSILLFLVFISFSFLWNYILDYLLGLIGFWVDNPWILFYIKGHVTAVFCGLIIPLNLFPSWIRHILDYLPFQYYVYYPYQVLMGYTTASVYVTNLSIFMGWIVVIILITLIVWKKSINRFTAAGG
jgi:ABC-2 type transport system permease protein